MMTALSRVELPLIEAGSPTYSYWQLETEMHNAKIRQTLPDVLPAMREELDADEAFYNWQGSQLSLPWFPGVSDTDLTDAIIEGRLRLGLPRVLLAEIPDEL